MNEFNLIKKYFKKRSTQKNTLIGIGDDAAIINIPSNHVAAVSTDTLIEGVHFPHSTHAEDIGYKALAVNLSDLAAMGAAPAWFTLALTLPHSNSRWLNQFSKGLFELAKQFNIELIGGDLTRGSLSITIQVIGLLPTHKKLLRSGAKAGDKIYVTGTLGDAGVALAYLKKKIILPTKSAHSLLKKLNCPWPNIQAGYILRDYANSAIDVSDGLLADLNHILNASHVGAIIDTNTLPLSNILKENLSIQKAHRYALTAGDDYELCFTLPSNKEKKCLTKLAEFNIKATCIGEITSNKQLRLKHFQGNLPNLGYKHF